MEIVKMKLGNRNFDEYERKIFWYCSPFLFKYYKQKRGISVK